MGLDLNPEQLKAVSQNMSHKNLSTTVGNYYEVNEFRKDQIIESLDIEGRRKQQKLKDNAKYQFIMSQINNEKTVDQVFALLAKTS